MKTKIVRSHTADFKPAKQVNGKMILPPLVFPALGYVRYTTSYYRLAKWQVGENGPASFARADSSISLDNAISTLIFLSFSLRRCCHCLQHNVLHIHQCKCPLLVNILLTIDCNIKYYRIASMDTPYGSKVCQHRQQQYTLHDHPVYTVYGAKNLSALITTF